MTRVTPLLPLMLLSALGLPSLAQTLTQTTPSDQQALIDRLLRVNNPQGSNTVTFGALPETLPLTLSSGVRVQATVRSVGLGGTPSYRIFAVGTGTLEAARRSLLGDLQASDWQPIPILPVRGFQASDGALNSTFFREGQFPLTLNINVQNVQERVELDITVNAVNDLTISSLKNNARYAPKSAMPVLFPLPGASVSQAPDVGGSRQGYVTSAHVLSNLSANEVTSFYSAQLRKAGWRAVTDTRSGELRVVTYLLTDLGHRQAVGVLGIRTQAEGDYILTASVNGFNPL
ncbi:hypothetical protein [Deinococcus sp.]|uniref:hypothetical protein n=1 Tax=Deinococcus sp. TaxID=47478 RepID=UPI003C7BBB1E